MEVEMLFNVKYCKRDEITSRNGYINIIKNEDMYINKIVQKLSDMHKKSTQRTLCSLLYGILPHHLPMCIYNI